MTRGRIRVLELRSVWGTGGGPEKTILYGAVHATPHRFAITVCYVRDLRDTVFGIDDRARALDVDYVEVRERHSFDTRIWSALKQLVRDRGIDIVHSHDYKTSLLALLLSRRTGIVPLATSHGWTGQTWRERFAYYPLDRFLLARFPRVIAVSTDIKQKLVASGARPDRVTVVLNGIDPAAFRRDPALAPVVRRELGFGPDHIVIGAVGRLERQKRFDLLLQAFVPIVAARPACRLVICGDGTLKEELQAQRRALGLDQSVVFPGHRTDIAHLHHAFDVFVQSSEYEGTPNSVLEAMAMESPIVATDVGGTSELASDGVQALIVPPRDVAALTSGIQAVLRSPAAARSRAEAARRRIETDLSFDARNRRLEGIYEELTRGRPGVDALAPSGVPNA